MSQRVTHPGLDILPFRVSKVIEVIWTLRRTSVIAIGQQQRGKAHLCQRGKDAQPLLTTGVETMHEQDPCCALSWHEPRRQRSQLARDTYIIIYQAQRAFRITLVDENVPGH